MVTLYFTKKFTGGILNGFTYNDYISFPSVERAVAFVANKSGSAKARRGFGSPWKMVDHSFQKYDRD